MKRSKVKKGYRMAWIIRENGRMVALTNRQTKAIDYLNRHPEIMEELFLWEFPDLTWVD